MADLMQQARELLNAARARLGVTPKSSLLAQEAAAWEAIAAALRAAPEGYVLVPVEPTEEMQVAALGKNWPAMSPQSVWAVMLAASPQGVKDV